MDVPEIFTFLALRVTELPSEANKVDFKFTVLPLGLYTSSDDNSLLFAPQPWMIANSVKFAADSFRVIVPAPPDVLAYKTLRDIENRPKLLIPPSQACVCYACIFQYQASNSVLLWCLNSRDRAYTECQNQAHQYGVDL